MNTIQTTAQPSQIETPIAQPQPYPAQVDPNFIVIIALAILAKVMLGQSNQAS